MTYDTMTDAELDAAVAKRLGWKQGPCGLWYTSSTRWQGYQRLSFSTDIAAAMGLVKEEGYFYLRGDPVCNDWDCIIENSYQSGPTPARAICLAWLMAMDEKEAKP